jgi:DNA-binding transcriptional LysR family regulator
MRALMTNLFDGRFDIAILPPQLVEQSTVIRRTLSRSPRILVAAPAYLERYGAPESAAKLANHFLLIDPETRKKSAEFIDLYEGGRKPRQYLCASQYPSFQKTVWSSLLNRVAV